MRAYYTDENTIAFGGQFDGEYLYNVNDKSFKYIEEEETDFDETEVFKDDSMKIIERTMYSDGEVGYYYGSQLYLVDGEDYKLLTSIDPNTYTSKVTKNGVYTFASDVDEEIPVVITFKPFNAQ